MRGFLTINKVYDDRVERVNIERDNTVTDGFGISITNLLTSSPFRSMRDFQLGYWAAGSGTHYDTENYSEAQADSIRNCLYELSDPVSSVDGYGLESIIQADEGFAITVEQKWVEDDDVVYTTSGGVFAKLPPQNITSIEGDAIRAKITIDKEGLVGETLREFGLYINNPEGYQDEDRMILAAYKPLMDPIEKTNEFSIDLEWVIDFSNSDFFSDKIAESIYWVPTVKGVDPGDQYTESIVPGSLFVAQVETLNPTHTSGTLIYSEEGDAVKGTHYSLTGSSVVFQKGEQLKQNVVRAIGTGWFTPKVLRLGLSSYDGDRNIADKFYYGKPSYIDFVLPSSGTAPQLTFDSAVIPDTTQTILLDSSSTEPLTVYFDVSAEAGGTYTGPLSITIPSGVTSHDFTVTATAGFDYIVSAHNPVVTTKNLVGNSTIFDSHFVTEPLLGYADVSSAPEDFNSPNDRRFRNFIGGPSYFHVAVSATKDYQTDTTYLSTTPPPQPFLLKTQDASGPLSYGGSQIVYVPKEYYVWPGSDYKAPFMTESEVPNQVDGLSRSTGLSGASNYEATAASHALSLFVKDFTSATIPGASEDDDTIRNSEHFALELQYSTGEYTRTIFSWSGGVVSASGTETVGISNLTPVVTSVGDGWYRVGIVSTGAGSLIGTKLSYRVYPHVISSMNVDSTAPLDVSGTMCAGLQFETGTAPTTYVPKADQFNTPIGGVNSASVGTTETRFTL